jgi:TolA-binding protein
MSASTPTLELGLILRNTQQAVRVSEAALEITQRIETDFSHRFTALEGRFTSLEGRVTSLAAGQNSLQRAVLRIADTQDAHSARLGSIEGKLDDHGGRLDRIDGRLDAIEATLGAIAATLAAISARLP